MESKTKNKQTRETIAQMVKRSFNGEELALGEDAVTELKEGWFNAVYIVRLRDGREVILKIAPPAEVDTLEYEKNIMEIEVAMLRLIKTETKVPVPEIYYFDSQRDLCDSDYFFMEKLRGSNYNNIKGTLSQDVIEKLDYQIASYTRQMNEIIGSGKFGYEGNPKLQGETWREAFMKMLEALLSDARQKQVDVGFSYQEIWKLMQKYAHRLEEVKVPCLVHWDCWDGNVFVEDGQVTGIIDFERALWGDPLLEEMFRYHNPSKLAGYGKEEFTLGENIRIKLYSIYLYLIMTIECEYRNYDDNSSFQFARKALKDSIEELQGIQETIKVNDNEYLLLKFLGKGKGGYSYLVSDRNHEYVLKQIHHEPCEYYQFGDKLGSELYDYERLCSVGISMPRLIDVDKDQERLIKEYIAGESIYDLVQEDKMAPDYVVQVREMCERLYPAGLNIDYFPTNFIVQEGCIYYIDYECNEYMEEWNFENWGQKYWSKTPEFITYQKEHI